MQILHAAMFQVSRGANMSTPDCWSVTENQETQWLLDEIATEAECVPSPDGWSRNGDYQYHRSQRQENNERERAEHAYHSHIQDELTISDALAVTGPGLEEDENLPENTTAQDDQEDETEQSSSESLQTRRQNFEDS